MNKLFLILLLITCFIKPICAQENSNSGYVLKIKKGKTKKEDSHIFWEIPVTLTNTTKDTLYYMSMSCSWQDYYSVNNNKINVAGVACDKNIPQRLMLAPSKSTTVALRILLAKTDIKEPVDFKIGFNLIKLSNNRKWFKDVDFKKRRSMKNIIWSNQITMKL